MTTMRTPLRRDTKHRITNTAIEAWKVCDYGRLHMALGLSTGHASPLPYEANALGVAPWMLEDKDFKKDDSLWAKSVPAALELQRELVKIAGMPNVRPSLELKLAVARRFAAYCQDRLDHPGDGCISYADPKMERESRQVDLVKALEQVEWRSQLLDEELQQ